MNLERHRPLFRLIPLLILFLLTTYNLSFGIDETAESGETDAPVESSPDEKEAAAEEPADEEAVEKLSLYLRTLAQDIATADYYEVLAWCQRLDLADTGNRATLQSRLYKYYEVTPEIGTKEKPKKRIVVQSASHTEYFTIEDIGEDYIILQGDVVVEFIDEEENVVHTIRAQRITINQSQNLLTASGDIRYTLKRGDEPAEEFRSRRFSFNMENWAGVFIEGEGKTEREVQPDEWISFSYFGESISRTENDTVILDNGSLTSSENTQDPYWHIKASKIYVLAPGEWAIQDAVLHVGRVPMFYVPYFFKPGDELFFHPALGYRNREGNFVQTTTYIVGRKIQKGGSLSFLRVTEAETEQYEQVIKGLYLRTKKTKRKGGIEPEEGKKVLKILADYYSRLGLFAGMVADFSPGWQFKGGIGFSRTIVPDTTGVYTPFIGAPGEIESQWNETSIGAITLPFRYGLENNFNLGEGNRTFSGDFGFFSDPFFSEDFYYRAEDIDWAKVLLGQGPEEQEVEEQPLVWDLYPEVKENFDWQITTHLVFPFENLLFKELSIPRLDLEFYWQSKSADDVTSIYDPARKFYYPSRLVVPNAEFRLRGDILHLPFTEEAEKKEVEKKVEKQPGKGFKLPVAEDEEKVKKGFAAKALKIPAVREDLSFTPPQTEGHTFTFSYDLYPKLLIENQFNYDGWSRARSVDFETRYTTLNVSGYHKFIAEQKLWGETVNMTDEVAFDGTYQGHFNRAHDVSDTDWENLTDDDYSKTGFDLNDTFLLTYYPFLMYRYFDQTHLYYALDWDFYRYAFDHEEDGVPIYTGEGPEFSRDRIEEHEVGSSLVYDPFGIPNSLDLSATLPPLLKEYEGEADFTVGPLNSNVKTAYREKPSLWEWDPMLITETLDFSPWVHFKEIVDYDLNDQDLTDAESILKLFKLRKDDPNYLIEQELLFEPEEIPLARSKSTLSFYGFQVYFLAEKLVPVEVDLDEGEWVVTSSREFLQPSKLYFGYNSLPMPLYMWRNRVKLDTNISTSWTIDLYRYTDSFLEFSLGLNLSVHEFVDIVFNVTSQNRKTYRYIPAFAKELDEPWVSPFEDLLKSFNFFNIEDRRTSSFNLKSINLAMVHHLGDWDLTLDYAGQQVLETQEDGTEAYVWSPVFTIVLQWKPIPEIRKEIRRDKDTEEINIRGTVQEVE